MDPKMTILFMSEKSGRRISARISYSFIKTLATIVICTVCASIISTAGYLHILQRSTSSKKTVAMLTESVRQLQAEKRETDDYRKWADDIIKKRFNHFDVSGKGSNGPSQTILDGEINTDTALPGPSVLDIENVDVTRINLSLDFNCSFKLLNTTGKNKTASGYVFVVASNRESIPPVYDVWPKTLLYSGMPVDYTSGSDFSIKYLKQVQARITQPDIGPKFNRVDILAYNTDGKLVMDRGFYIERMLRECPYE